MFLDATLRRNPELVRLAIHLHRTGRILPNTYVIDVDAVATNSRTLAEAAGRAGLNLYVMSKQFNHNPALARAVAAHIPRAVAVDWEAARVLAEAGIALGHVGHLVQPPDAVLERLVQLEPEVVTVFSLQKALALGRIAARLGRVQDVLLRVAGDADFFYPGQHGGISPSELPEVARRLSAAPGLRLAGVTSFPCLIYDHERRRATPTPNLATLVRSADLLRRHLGRQDIQVNAPSLTCCATIPLLVEAGATHGEPGHALTGTTPLHATADQPEAPAAVYVSEVSHLLGGTAYYFGGGLYPRSRVQSALVGRDPDRMQRVRVEMLPGDHIDYYGKLRPAPGNPLAVGDTVVCAFRMQMFTARSQLALVSRGRLAGLFDAANRAVPVPAHDRSGEA